MVTVVVVIHLLIAIMMIGLILLQKTEGNAAGGGFAASSATAMLQPRARANPLSLATTILGISFFVTSLGLALLAKNNTTAPSILDAPVAGSASAPKVTDVGPAATPDATPIAPSLEAPPAAPPPAVPTVPNN